MDNLDERLLDLREAVGHLSHGDPDDPNDEHYTAVEVIDSALAELRKLRSEVERHRMTSEERNAATVAAAVASPPAPFPSASVQYDDGRRVPVSVYAESLRGYLERTKEVE